jgi:hypothetical protein
MRYSAPGPVTAAGTVTAPGKSALEAMAAMVHSVNDGILDT